MDAKGMETKKIAAAVMGYGTIGSGVVEVLEKNRDVVAKSAGKEIEVKYVLDLREFAGTPVEHKIIHDINVIVEDPEVRIVVETMGGVHPAYEFVKNCMLAGKHVVTSNKALVAACGTELLEIAREKQVNFLFEASTGGGIPIIRTLYRSLSGEKIEEITGILNGTTNYILTKMDRYGETFEDALKEAQDLGYAERNPEADVEGYDTCRKIAILTAMATGKEVDFEDIYTEGITKITDIDFKYAEKLGMSVKLFGSSRIEGDRVTAFVAPVMIGPDNPLYGVNDVYNGILVKGNMLGTSMYFGSGAGKLPTASAVVADMIEAAVYSEENIPLGWTGEKQDIEPISSGTFRYFVRIDGTALPETEKLCQLLQAEKRIEIPGLPELGILTSPMTEAEFNQKKECVSGIISVIRAE